MAFFNIGFGNLVNSERVVAIVAPESAPVKRIVQEGKDRGMCIDATYGRRTKSVIVTDTDHVILSSLQVETLRGRINSSGRPENEKDDDAEITEGMQ